MSTLAEPAPAVRRRAAARPKVRRGVLCIVLVGLMLVGVVAINVALLRLNLRLDKLTQERAKLRADNAALSSQLSSQLATGRIQSLAQAQGLVPAAADATTYVDLHH